MVIDAIVGEVEGRNVIVLDDEVATGGSILELVGALRNERVGRISLACTHGLFTSGAIGRIEALEDAPVVESVNGDTGAVVLAPATIGAAPEWIMDVPRNLFDRGRSVVGMKFGTERKLTP